MSYRMLARHSIQAAINLPYPGLLPACTATSKQGNYPLTQGVKSMSVQGNVM